MLNSTVLFLILFLKFLQPRLLLFCLHDYNFVYHIQLLFLAFMCWHLSLGLFGFVIFIKSVVLNYRLQEQPFLSFLPTYLFSCSLVVSAFLLIRAMHSFTSLNSNPSILSTVMCFQKADWKYLCEEASCSSLLCRLSEGVGLPGVGFALFRTLSFPQVYGPLSIIRRGVEMLFERLLSTLCASATVRGFT